MIEAQEKAHKQEQPKQTLGQSWQLDVPLVINVARFHTIRKLEALDRRQAAINVIRCKTAGNVSKCDVDVHPDVLANELQPGTEVKLVTGRIGNDRTFVWTGSRRGEISRVSPSELQTITVQSQTTNPFEPDERVELRPEIRKSALEKELLLFDEFRNKEAGGIPARVILSGEFPRPHPKRLERTSGLDESQNRALGMAMDIEQRPVVIIHGPPGTGKTRTLCEIAKRHAGEGRRVLVLSHSNKGMQVPALELKKDEMPVHIAGSVTDKIDPLLHSDRIKRDVVFPVEELEQLETDQAGHDTKNMVRKLLLQKHREALKKAGERLRKNIEEGGVVFSTFGTLINDEILEETDFDVVIVDEATRSRMPEMLLAMKKAGKQIVLVGDPRQLGNIPLEIDEKKLLKDYLYYFPARELIRYDAIHGDPNGLIDATHDEITRVLAGRGIEVFEEGPFTNMVLSHPETIKDFYAFLDTNRRSLPNIVRVLSELIYDGKLKPGREAKEGENEGLVKWIDTANLKSGEKTKGTSKENPTEADIIVNEILDRVLSKDHRIQPEELGVIAAYERQAKLIKKRLKKRLWKNPELYERIARNIATVDAFQGDQRDVIIMSFTRSNTKGDIGFLDEQRRTGVGVGRARNELIMVGDSSTLVDNNTDPESQAFFEKLRGLVGKYGKIEPKEEEKGKRKRHGGHGSGKKKRIEASKSAAL